MIVATDGGICWYLALFDDYFDDPQAVLLSLLNIFDSKRNLAFEFWLEIDLD